MSKHNVEPDNARNMSAKKYTFAKYLMSRRLLQPMAGHGLNIVGIFLQIKRVN